MKYFEFVEYEISEICYPDISSRMGIFTVFIDPYSSIDMSIN